MPLRIKIIIGLIIVIPLGFGLKFYFGPGHVWCNDYAAAICYEVFWCLVAQFFFIKRRNIPVIAAAVFIITCVLEFLQLWHPPLLEAVRSTFIGAAIFGTTFDWLDFPHYALGCGLGWLVMRLLARARNGSS